MKRGHLIVTWDDGSETELKGHRAAECLTRIVELTKAWNDQVAALQEEFKRS